METNIKLMKEIAAKIYDKIQIKAQAQKDGKKARKGHGDDWKLCEEIKNRSSELDKLYTLYRWVRHSKLYWENRGIHSFEDYLLECYYKTHTRGFDFKTSEEIKAYFSETYKRTNQQKYCKSDIIDESLPDDYIFEETRLWYDAMYWIKSYKSYFNGNLELIFKRW